jgi:YVTN family beta-propeller protein
VRVDEARFPGRQGRLVFAYLVAEHGRPVARDELADALWGDAPPATWEKALVGIVSKLRVLLDECGVDASSILTSAFGCYRLDLPEGSQVDVVAASEAAQEAEEALAADDLARSKDAAIRAASVARKPFLPGEQGAWVETKRRELADILDDALGCLADACLRSGDTAGAAKWAEEAIAREPFRESGYRRLMLAHASGGNRAEALRVYDRCRRLVAEELGAYPSPETESVYRTLLQAPSAQVAAAAEAAPAVLLGRERNREGRPSFGRWVRPRRGVAVSVGAALLAAAIAVSVIEFRGSGSRGLDSARANAVALIKADTNRLVADVSVGDGPTSLAADEDAVWVTNARSVARIDRRTRSVVEHIPVGSQPSGIAVGGDAVWVADSLDGTVTRIDPKTNTVVQTVRGILTPTAVAAGFRSVWVTSADERSVKRIDADSGDVVDTIQTGALRLGGIAVGARSVWVTDVSSRSVLRIDPGSGSVVHTVAVGNGPRGIAFGAGFVWVANSLDGTVYRIDPGTDKVTAVIAVGEGPDGVAAESDAVWVSSEFSRSIVRIDPAEARVVETIPVGNRPRGLAVFGDEVWFAVQPSGAGHRGGRLVVPVDAFGSIDPAFGLPANFISVYDGLLGPAWRGGNEGMQIVPNLADSLPEVTAGGTRYAFTLRRGIRYSNGTIVKASDFRRAFERLLRLGQAWPSFKALVGADVCTRRARSCDLRRGVQTDDKTGAVVFQLRRPDGQFLFDLIGSAPVPPGTPDREVRTHPIPSTGPYMIERDVPRRVVRLVRNPYFRVWSHVARPDGFPDAIEFRAGVGAEAAVRAVERGRADIAAVPPDRLEEVKTHYAAQLHVHPDPADIRDLLLNTRLPPFDDVRVRRALNYAVDRAAVAAAQGGSQLAQPLCQLRPPSIAGYRPYCPYTIDPSPAGVWKAPDLARARRLVAASGTSGMTVTVWTWARVEPAARQVVAALQRLGYRTRLRRIASASAYFLKVFDKPRLQAAMYGAVSGTGGQPSYILPWLTCGYRPEEDPRHFCNRRIDAEIRRALRVEATDPNAAVRSWVRIERELVDQAPWVPLFTPQAADLVSKRAGNYQSNPVLWGVVLLDQLWVR